ncbi:MAG: hypothetical protein E5X00_22175 [Mesorhizobium sp.]|nr:MULTISPECIES: hypothetical protein [unclassified Mesorhizobium]TIS72739.1 MAG: hypothetical protein E5X00_22175 [Mesorhizobium sp.]
MAPSAILPIPSAAGIAMAFSLAILDDMTLAWATDRLNPAVSKTASSMARRCFGDNRAIVGLA